MSTNKQALLKKLNRRLNDAFGFQRTSGGKHTTISLSISECKSVIVALGELDKWQQESSTWKSVAEKQLAIAIEAEKRIAELEAREIVLPQPAQWDISEVLLDKEKVIKVINAAGITVKGE